MLEISASLVRRMFGAMLEQVQSGEEIFVTRHGRLLARLVPCASFDRRQAIAAAERIRARARRLNAGPFLWDSLKAGRDVGRA